MQAATIDNQESKQPKSKESKRSSIEQPIAVRRAQQAQGQPNARRVSSTTWGQRMSIGLLRATVNGLGRPLYALHELVSGYESRVHVREHRYGTHASETFEDLQLMPGIAKKYAKRPGRRTFPFVCIAQRVPVCVSSVVVVYIHGGGWIVASKVFVLHVVKVTSSDVTVCFVCVVGRLV